MVNKHKIVIVTVYVDDLLLLTNDTNEKERVKHELMKKFKMKDLGPIRSCLGITRETANIENYG